MAIYVEDENGNISLLIPDTGIVEQKEALKTYKEDKGIPISPCSNDLNSLLAIPEGE